MVFPPSLRANRYPIPTGRGKDKFNFTVRLSPGIPNFTLYIDIYIYILYYYLSGKFTVTATSAVR